MKENSPQNKSFENTLRETQAFKKIQCCFESMEQNKSFMARIKELRKSIGLNIKGLPAPRNSGIISNDYSIIFSKLSEKDESTYYDKVAIIANEYNLEIFGNVLEYYILYGSIEPFIRFGSVNIAQIFDLQEIFYDDYKRINPFSSRIGELENTQGELPIVILINPYMSQRDILDFIKKTYKDWIEPIQKDYKNENTPLGRARRKSSFVKKRNEFIFKNKNKPASEIVSLVNSKFGQLLDYTYINKIIRDEESRRN